MTLLRLWRHLPCLAFALSFGCATRGAAPEKTETHRLEDLHTTQASNLHAQLATCRQAPGKFCQACLNNRLVFLDEADRTDWHHICRNVVTYRHCAPGFEDPNLPLETRRAFCEEATQGQIDEAANEEDSGAPAVPLPEPTPEELARLKSELVKAIEKVDAEDAKVKAAGSTSPKTSDRAGPTNGDAD